MIYYLVKYTDHGQNKFSIHYSFNAVRWSIIDSYSMIKLKSEPTGRYTGISLHQLLRFL